MTLLPVVERELRVAARRKFTWRVRFIGVLVALLVFGWMFAMVSRPDIPLAQQGLTLFRTLVVVGFAYCLFAGVLATADSLSRERREGTLGLLFLTNLRGYDVILGKLVAHSLNAAYGLMAILPLLAVPLNLGGVTGEMLLQAGLALLNTIFIALAVGIFVSGKCTDERRAAFWSALLLFATLALPFFVAFMVLLVYGNDSAFDPTRIWIFLAPSPAFPLISLLLPVPRGLTLAPPEAFYISFSLVHLFGWVLLGCASFNLARSWQDKTQKSIAERSAERVELWGAGDARQQRAERRDLLDSNPFLWLALRNRARRRAVWVFLGAMVLLGIWAVFKYDRDFFDRESGLPFIMGVHAFLKLWIVTEACQRLVWDRRAGALELLLTTPQTPKDVVRGQLQALWHQFGPPVVMLVTVEVLLLGRQMGMTSMLMQAGLLLLDGLALAWLGIWFALTSRTTTLAIVKSLACLVAVPWMVVSLGGAWTAVVLSRVAGLGIYVSPWNKWEQVWFAFGVLADVGIGLIWARSRVQKHFQATVTGTFSTRHSELA